MQTKKQLYRFLVLMLLTLGLTIGFTACGSGGGGGGSDSNTNSGGGGNSVDGDTSVFEEHPSFVDVTDTETVTLEDGSTVEAAKDEVLIYAKDDITKEELDALIGTIKGMGGSVVGSMADTATLQVRIPSTTLETAFISAVESLTGVDGAGVNLEVEHSQDNASGYEKYLQRAKTYSLEALGKATATAVDYPSFDGDYWIDQVNADEAWSITTGSDSDDAKIGIVDSGIMSNPIVVDNSRITRYDDAGNLITDDDTSDLSSHGLWVTAFSAGYFDSSSIKYRGMAWKNKVVMVDVGKSRCIGSLCLIKQLYLTDVQRGITTAIAKNAQIINVSIGAKLECSDTQSKKLTLQRKFREGVTGAVDAAKRKDRLVVFAAGNDCEKEDNQLLPDADDIKQDSWKTNSMIVAATDSTKTDASFTRMGDVVNIAAPGDDIGWGNGSTRSGTSYAAPLVTGTAALVKSLNTTLSAPEIRYILLDNADSTVKFSNDSVTGPKLFLNTKKSVDAAKLTSGIDLTTVDTISILKDETKSVSIPVTIPETTVTSLDVVFVVDVSGSYGDDINNLQAKANEIISNLKGRGIDVQFGVTSFSDFPISPYGSASRGDNAFFLNQIVTDNTDAVINAINQLDNPLHNGADGPESQLETLYQVATGEGLNINGDGDYNDPGDLNPQSVGWRTGALKVVLFATDADFHDSAEELAYPGHNFTDTLNALVNKGIIVIGLQSGGSSSTEEDMRRVTDATGGTLYELSYDSSQIADKIFEGLNAALAEVDLSLERISGNEWIQSIEPETYSSVKPGETKTFVITLKGQKNRSVIKDLNYDVYLWVWGDNSALLRRIRIPISVPSL